MDVTVQDTDSGLQAITDILVTNGTVSVPPFTAGTTSEVIVTAIKATQGTPTTWSFHAIDVAGNDGSAIPSTSTSYGRRAGLGS